MPESLYNRPRHAPVRNRPKREPLPYRLLRQK